MTFGKFVTREIKAEDIRKAIENAGTHQRLFVYTETIEDVVFKTSDNHVVHTAKNFWPAMASGCASAATPCAVSVPERPFRGRADGLCSRHVAGRAGSSACCVCRAWRQDPSSPGCSG